MAVTQDPVTEPISPLRRRTGIPILGPQFQDQLYSTPHQFLSLTSQWGNPTLTFS